MAIMPQDTVQGLQKIASLQKQLEELRSNKYVFASKGEGAHHIEGWQSLKWVINKAEFDHSQVFSSSKLRKYIATETL